MDLIIALVLHELTELVTVDQSVSPPVVSPEDLFTLTFDHPRVGLSNEQMALFKRDLAIALPQADGDIALLDANAHLQIGAVGDFIRASLAQAGVNVG